MRAKYYSFPLDTGVLMQKQEHPMCSLRQSVADHLHLIITTAFGEMQADVNYGNSIWEHDFDNLTTRVRQQEMMKESLANAIKKNEKRLDNIKVDVIVSQEELQATIKNVRIKKRLDIQVKALLAATSEEIVFRDSFFVSPLSYS
jgi:phage baseplate assembly protein W